MSYHRRHFLDDPGVAVHVELRIGTPDNALACVRTSLKDMTVE